MIKLIVAVVAAVALGIVGSKYLFIGSWLSLFPWTVAGGALGIWCHTKKEAVINGAVYGFVLAFVFMLAGYSGSMPIIVRFPFFAIIGLGGAFYGMLVGYCGWLIGAVSLQK